MEAPALRSEERIGLVVAIAAHAALLVLLVVRPPSAQVVLPPQRIEVTLSDDVGLTSTSPEPDADAAPDVAPMIGEALPSEPEPAVAPPNPQAAPSPRPSPRPAPRAPAVRPSPAPKPETRAPAARPAPSPSPRTSATPSQRAPRETASPPKKAGGSRIGGDFLEGVKGAQSSGSSRSPRAAEIGPAVRSSLSGAIARQLKPHWIAPQGADSELLVTVLTWDLNADGSLDGKPRVVGQSGVTDANRAQAGRHAEQAIRAVELAAPFNLPADYYDAWKHVSAFRFDKRLSQ